MASKAEKSKYLRSAGVVFITLEFGISFKIITQLWSITMIKLNIERAVRWHRIASDLFIYSPVMHYCNSSN